VEAGDFVTAGDRLAVLEAMKMEMTVTAPYDGRVRTVLISPNVQVGVGVPLLILEREEDAAPVSTTQRLSFAALGEGSRDRLRHTRCTHHLGELEALIRGYDVDVDRFEQAVDSEGLLCADALADEAVWEREAELLETFIDLMSLFRPAPADDDDLGDLARRSTRDYFFDYLRDPGARGEGLPAAFVQRLRTALAHYGIESLDPKRRLRRALYRMYIANQRLRRRPGAIMALLQGWREADDVALFAAEYRPLLNRLADETRRRFPEIHDLAAEVIFEAFDRPLLEETRAAVYEEADGHLAALASASPADRQHHVQALVAVPQPLKTTLARRFRDASPDMRQLLLEVMARRYYRMRSLEDVEHVEADGIGFLSGTYAHEGTTITLIATHVDHPRLAEAVTASASLVAQVPDDHDVVVDFYGWRDDAPDDPALTAREFSRFLDRTEFGRPLRRVVLAVSAASGGAGMADVEQYTYRWSKRGYREEREIRGLHPMMGKRLEVWRLSNFKLKRLPSGDDTYLFRGLAHENPHDERLFALAEVRDLTAVRDDAGRLIGLPNLERTFAEACSAIRRFQVSLPSQKRPVWNRILLYVWPTIDLQPDEMGLVVSRLAPATEGLGIEKVVVRSRAGDFPADGGAVPEFEILNPEGTGVTIRVREPRPEPLEPLDDYAQKVVRLRSRGIMYPYELIRMITPADGDGAGFPRGAFTEFDLDGDRLVPVSRPPGENTANIIVGEITSYTTKHPEGMTRILIAGDPSRGMGSLAEAECRRINAALELALDRGLPVEWYAVSAGALISMDSGTENMDWIALVLRRIIEFTQAGGELNVVVTGINVGAQPYWNAEATMLMHTKGILVMAPDSAMVLTGKQALDYSGGVSAQDNQGIGGYEQIMGPNGQAQYSAPDVAGACQILLRHYEHSYVAPGERFPRRSVTVDPPDRDVGHYRHGGRFETVGDVFSDQANPGRKFPFEIRRVMEAVVDTDSAPLERWFGMADAEVAVVWDAHLGGIPVSLLGFESKPLPRFGPVPADGPDQWTAGTLFPQSSRKVARAINAASGSRPVVILANLSGFDGSPESLRKWQLEYGAEIGRAVVNFDGPIVFCVVSRYHGGAFVVFSNRLNDHMEVAAVEGARASVIGGAPAAAVVFAREVRRRTEADERVAKLRDEFEDASGAESVKLRGRLERVRAQVHSERLGEVADEFDGVHSVQRAKAVGSVQEIIPPERLRPYLIEAIERGMAKFGPT
jgi:acetyl-CoA carboxylase carboxyltransferase component/pyruvate/2-oxoglutarate dehydrogenase complex dihydrolipoamide acyltransferase (E2) component